MLVPARPRTEAERLAQRSVERPGWYGTRRWKELRLRRLQHDGWRCQQTSTPLIGTYPAWDSAAVDHVIPHRWSPELFWDFDNLQSVCKAWHDSAKQSLEKRGLA